MNRLANYAKRFGDISLASILLVASAPLQAAIALAIRARLGPPVLFKQHRPGRHGKSFVLLKFRTMLPATEDRVDDESRLTRFGSALRATSFDELPSLWNVVHGEMSLVGPRPLLMQYLPLYDEEQSRRHDVLPGLTGLAQVSGRNALSWNEKLRLDVEYVDNQSLGLDLKLLWRTIAIVLNRTGISSESSATMPVFLGTTDDIDG